MVPGGCRDQALHPSQQSLLGHAVQNTLERCPCAFVDVTWDLGAPSSACELWAKNSQLKLLCITNQSLCTMVHRPYCPGFPPSVICLAPLYWTMWRSWLYMNKNNYKNQNTKEEQLMYCQRASGTGRWFVLYCYVGLLVGDIIMTGLTEDHQQPTWFIVQGLLFYSRFKTLRFSQLIGGGFITAQLSCQQCVCIQGRMGLVGVPCLGSNPSYLCSPRDLFIFRLVEFGSLLWPVCYLCSYRPAVTLQSSTALSKDLTCSCSVSPDQIALACSAAE